ncbi:lipopolysaccharide biosynthesis protein [Microbacterium sp. DWRC1-3]|uniref:lipopolysaccharide biosynthesis protein n=1 Tax=Microbacterium sp. DWRC1-3 TaxID=2804630 RepID=UPI003CEA87AD
MKQHSVAGQLILSTYGMGIQGVARLFYTLVIGRTLSPEALSDTTAILSLAVYLALVWPAGAAIAATRYLANPETAADSIRALRTSFWVSTIPLSLIAIPIAWWMTGDLPIGLASAVLVFSYNAYVFSRGVLTGENRLLRAAVLDTVSSLLAITVLLLVLTAHSSWVLLLPLSAGYLLFALFARSRTVAAPGPSSLQRETLAFTREATFGALVMGGMLPATMIFVRAFDTPTAAGMFAAALTLATPANIVAQAVSQVLLPHFARLRADPSAMRASHRRLFALTAAGFGLIFGALIVFAPWILDLFYGTRYADGVPAMQVLLGIVLLLSLTSAPSALLLASGRERLAARIWMFAFVIGTATMLLLAPVWGQWGALVGYALGGGGGSIVIILCAFLAPTTSTHVRRDITT